MKVSELAAALAEVPEDWEIKATSTGKTIGIHEPNSHKSGKRYGYLNIKTGEIHWYTTR